VLRWYSVRRLAIVSSVSRDISFGSPPSRAPLVVPTLGLVAQCDVGRELQSLELRSIGLGSAGSAGIGVRGPHAAGPVRQFARMPSTKRGDQNCSHVSGV